MKAKGGEVVVGRGAVRWLRALGFEVYQEVQIGQGGLVIDVVGTLGPFVVAIECKATFGLAVIEQAERWTRSAHYSWVCVPLSDTSGSRHFAERVCRDMGIGVLYVIPELVDVATPAPHFGPVVQEEVHARFNRHAATREIRRHLLEGQKTAAPAGTQGGGRWTPFRATCEAVREVVTASPGISLRDAIEGIRHHYASVSAARACLSKWIEAGKIPGVVLRREGRKPRLYLEG